MITTPSRLIVPLALSAALGIGVLATVAPALGVAAAAVMLGVSAALVYPERTVRFWWGFTAFTLAGYAFIGKGFAYIGRSPVFIGEIALALGILALSVRGRLGHTFRIPCILLMASFSVWSAAQTVPYIDQYGMDALRDAALWGYGAFTVLIVALLSRPEPLAQWLAAYGRVFWWLPFWTPVFGVVARIGGDAIPRVPGTDVEFLLFKPGDMAVHLGGVATFLMLGLQSPKHEGTARRRLDLVWWGFWLGGLVLAASASRGGFLSVVVGIGIVVGLRPETRWWKPALVTIVVGGAFAASNVVVDLGMERKVSSRQLASNLMSIVDSKQDISLSGTREWRLEWWGDIVHYTVFGPYRWTGKGFGVNLADEDGFQGGQVDYVPNRSPHNVQMTVLARTGIPGVVLWVLLQAAFVTTLLRAYFRSRRLGWDWWGRVNLWTLAYWAALLINGTFDVYIEGPQGGIWFWCVMGFGLAAVEAQRAQQARR